MKSEDFKMEVHFLYVFAIRSGHTKLGAEHHLRIEKGGEESWRAAGHGTLQLLWGAHPATAGAGEGWGQCPPPRVTSGSWERWFAFTLVKLVIAKTQISLSRGSCYLRVAV